MCLRALVCKRASWHRKYTTSAGCRCWPRATITSGVFALFEGEAVLVSQWKRHPWIWPGKQWQHMYVDYAGPFKGRMFLIHTLSKHSVQRLRRPLLFYESSSNDMVCPSNWCPIIPTALLSGIWGVFASFTNSTIPLCLKPTNFKQALKVSTDSSLPLQHQLGSFLLKYRITPHATTGETASPIFPGRQDQV